MKKIRVLQLIDSVEAGGAERMAVQIASGLAERGIESSLIATRQEGSLKESIHLEVNYLFLNRKSTIDFNAIHKLYCFIKKNKINIIHAHSSSFFIAALIRFFLPRLNLIWHCHLGSYNNVSVWRSLFLKWSLLRFSGIIVVNKKLENWAKINFKININVLRNFPHFEINKIEKTSLKGTQNKKIICLANLRPEKDHFNLIQAFEKVYSEYPDWSLHLVGKDFKDAYSKNLKAAIDQLNCKESIFFYDSCQDIQYILGQATIGILSSKSEGFPVSLLEYGLAGLPVITTDVGDCSEVILHQKTGLLVPASDPKVLAQALESILNNEAKRLTYGANLKKHVENGFGKESFLDKLLQIYDTL